MTAEKPQRDPKIETNVLPDGHVVLLSKETEWAQTITPLAALVWEFCDGTNTVEDILTNIRSIPEVPEVSTDDVRALLTELTESGFLLED